MNALSLCSHGQWSTWEKGRAETQWAIRQTHIPAEDSAKTLTPTISWKLCFQLWMGIIIPASVRYVSSLASNGKFVKQFLSRLYTKMENWRKPFVSREFPSKQSVWQYCPVLWPPNGQCSINSASDEQAGQPNHKWEGGGGIGVWIMHITLP